MAVEPSILLPQSIADAIRQSGATWGWIDLVQDRREQLYIVAGWSKAQLTHRPGAVHWLEGHYTAHHAPTQMAGVWYLADGDLHDLGQQARNRRTALTLDAFKQTIHGGWRQPSADGFPV